MYSLQGLCIGVLVTCAPTTNLFMPATERYTFDRFLRLPWGSAMRSKTGRAGFAYCWYVTFVNEWRPGSSGAPSKGKTKSFRNEIEAKEFARSMLSAGFSVRAGTLNPHRPRRQLSGSEIDQWLDEIR